MRNTTISSVTTAAVPAEILTGNFFRNDVKYEAACAVLRHFSAFDTVQSFLSLNVK
jgi:hypothetical protein